MNIQLVLSSDVLDAFGNLPKAQQRKVQNFLRKFRSNSRSAGYNFERIRDAANPRYRSARIDKKYRAIILQPKSGNQFLVLWIDVHDDAYAWAQRSRTQINPETGTIQVFTATDVEPPKMNGPEDQLKLLFHHIRDRNLKRLGIPDELIPLVRTFHDATDLNDNREAFPIDAYDALDLLAEGFSLDEVYRDRDRTDQDVAVDTEDFETALKRGSTRRQFVVVDDDLELQEMLNAPLEKWRVFLHPSQRRIVEMHARGPVRVLGGAGTGKTVVAMHRARRLATDVFTEPSDRILFTTFTRNLAADIAAKLKSICDADAFKRIEIVNFNRWVWQQLKTMGLTYRIAYQKERDEAWAGVLDEQPEMPHPKSFYRDEFNGVILANGIDNERDYLRVSRVGRGRGLNRRKRREIWPIFSQYRARLLKSNLREAEDSYRDLRVLLTELPTPLPYKAVIVDEAQDMNAEAMRLIRSIIPEQADNDLFIVGDAHQRIYGRPVVLSRCGINIRGRGRRLRLNYRTPDEVRSWAVRLLKNCSFDDLDGATDTVRGYRSLLFGEVPEVLHFARFSDEVNAIIRHIEGLSGSEERHRVCLVARTKYILKLYDNELRAHGMAVHRISEDKSDDPLTPGVRLGTLHRVKGLEFDHMIVAAASADMLPLKKALASSEDLIEQRYTEKKERSLLYVAATRAKKSLLVTSFGEQSQFLTATSGG